MTKIVNATFEDLPRLARCHRAAFPKTLSTAMGQQYVEKMLEWYLVDNRAFIFLLEEEGKCVGYCGGLKFDGTARVGSASSMIQHSYDLAVSTFIKKPWLFFHPEFFSKYTLVGRNIIRRLKKVMGVKERTQSGGVQLPEPHSGLIVIGVDPAFQGKGNGSKLLQEFERISSVLNFKKMMLTVRTNNRRAIHSYLRNGWKVLKVEGPSISMEKLLP